MNLTKYNSSQRWATSTSNMRSGVNVLRIAN